MASNVIRDVVIKIAIKQEEVRLKAPDITPILLPFKQVEGVLNEGLPEAVKGFETAATKSVGKVSDEVEQLSDSIQGIKPDLEGIAKASEEARQKLTDDTLKMGEGFRTAGEGAFTLGRGIAFVGVASEEDLQKVVQTIAQFQGAFDIFKGGIDVVKGLTEGTRALRIVTTSAAVAETGLASANTAVATTGAAATVSMRGLLLTLGPIAIALTAVAAAFLFFKDAPEDIDDTTDALERQRKKLDQISDINLQSIGAQLDFGELSVEKRILLLKQKLRIESEQITAEAKRTVFELVKEAVKRGEIVSAAELTAVLTKAEVARLVTKLGTEREIINIKKSQRAEIKSAFDLTQSTNDLAEKGVQIAKDKLALDKDSLKTFKERFGAASAEDKLEAKRAARISAEKGVGALTRPQAELLGRLGGEAGKKLLSEFNRRSFELGGGKGFREDLGQAAPGIPGFQEKIRESEEALKQNQEALKRKQEEARKELEEFLGGEKIQVEELEDNLETIRESKEKILDIVSQLIEIETSNKQQINELQITVDKLNN